MSLPQAVLDSAISLFGTSESRLEHLHGGHFSHVYRFTQDSQSVVLRILPASPEINLNDMQSIFEWMRYMSENHAPVPKPIQSINNKYIEEINHGAGTYLIMMIEAADGILSEDIPLEQWSNELYQTLGIAVGKIHSVASQFNLANPAKIRPIWEDIPNNFNPEQDPNPELTIIHSERKNIMDYLATLPKDNDSFGLIHGDLHMGNFFIDVAANKITIFDFDDCVYGWFMMDIATLVFDYPVVYPQTSKNQLVEDFFAHLLKGYSSVKPTSDFWVGQLPNFLKLLEIGIYMQVYREHDPADHESWIGKFMKGRKALLENGVPYLDIDFKNIFRSG